MNSTINQAGRVLALVAAVVLAYVWWHTNGLPNFVYQSYSIGNSSSLAMQFVGFLSIFATFAIVIACILCIGACLSFTFRKETDKGSGLTKTSTRAKFDLMFAHRLAGTVIVFLGLFIWFLAYQIPDYIVSNVFYWKLGLARALAGTMSVIAMFAGAALGLFVTIYGGGLVLSPNRVRART